MGIQEKKIHKINYLNYFNYKWIIFNEQNEQLIKYVSTLLMYNINSNIHLPWEPTKVLIAIYLLYNGIADYEFVDYVVNKNSAMFGIYKH